MPHASHLACEGQTTRIGDTIEADAELLPVAISHDDGLHALRGCES